MNNIGTYTEFLRWHGVHNIIGIIIKVVVNIIQVGTIHLTTTPSFKIIYRHTKPL